MSSPGDNLPTSTFGRRFSAQLHDIFGLNESLLQKEKEVESKNLELTRQQAELQALEARLQAARRLLGEPEPEKKVEKVEEEDDDSHMKNGPTSPTPANTEVGPRSSRKRNPLPIFEDPALEKAAEDESDEDDESDPDISDEEAPQPPKKDNPVALQAPRALPVLGGEIEARKGAGVATAAARNVAVAAEASNRGRDERHDDGFTSNGGWGRMGDVKGGDIIGQANATKPASTIANVDVSQNEKIEISFNQKEQPKLSDRQGEAWPAPPQTHANLNLPQGTAAANGYYLQQNQLQNRNFEPETADSRYNAPPPGQGVASINGGGAGSQMTAKPGPGPQDGADDHDDGDDLYAGDLIDDYGGYDDTDEDERAVQQQHPYQNMNQHSQQSQSQSQIVQKQVPAQNYQEQQQQQQPHYYYEQQQHQVQVPHFAAQNGDSYARHGESTTTHPVYVSSTTTTTSSTPIHIPMAPVELPAEPVELPAEPVELPAEPVVRQYTYTSLFAERKPSAVSTIGSRSDAGTSVNSVREIVTSPKTPVSTQENSNTKYLLNDLTFPQPPADAERDEPEPAPPAPPSKNELPPLPPLPQPEASSSIVANPLPKRKPLRSSEEQQEEERGQVVRPATSSTMTVANEPVGVDRPPTPPSKAQNHLSNLITSPHNRSDLSIASNSPVARMSPAPSESATHEKPLPTPIDPNTMGQSPASEKAFSSLLKMKKSFQGLRKKAQTAAAASSPVRPPSSDAHRNFSPVSAGTGYPSDPRAKDEPPLPPIPPEKLPPGVTLHTTGYSQPLPPPPQVANTPGQPDVFDRVQASIQAQYPQPYQQQQQQLPREESQAMKKLGAGQKKTIEAIAKFSGKMSALRSLRKKDGGREDEPSVPLPQEPPLAQWEIEQRAQAKPNPYGVPISPPQTASPASPPHTSHASGAPIQSWNTQMSGATSINGFTPISPPPAPIKDDALPPPPAEELPPPIPTKTDMPKRKEVSTVQTEDAPKPSLLEKSTATIASKLGGFSIFPSSLTSRPIVAKEAESTPPPPPPAKEQLPSIPVDDGPPSAPPKTELPAPPPVIEESAPEAPKKAESKKPAHLNLTASNNLTVEKPLPSSGLLPPVSPGFQASRGGKTETYSYLGDYYFGGDDDDGDEVDDYYGGATQPGPPSPKPPVKAVSTVKETEAEKKYRIQSFAPFSFDDFSSQLSFSFDTPSSSENVPPVPKVETVTPKKLEVEKSLPAPSTSTSTSSFTPLSVSVPVLAPISIETPAPEPVLPPLPTKVERKPPVVQERIPEPAPLPAPEPKSIPKSLPEAPKPEPTPPAPEMVTPEPPKTIARVPSKSELRENYPTPQQTVAHRSILSPTMSNGRDSEGSPPLPMKDIPEEGPYPANKPSPLSTEWTVSSPITATAPAASKGGYASSGVSSVRSSGGHTETPSATASTPRTSLSSSVNGASSAVPTSAPRAPSGEQVPGQYPARNSSQGYSSQSPRPSSQETMHDRRMPPGPPKQGGPPPPGARGPPPPGGPQGMPPRGRMPGPPGTPDLRGRPPPGFRPGGPGGPMNPNYPPRSASPAFSERSVRPRGHPPPRSSSPAFSERSVRPRGPPPRSASPAFSMRGDPRMQGPPHRGPPPPGHQRKRSNSMEILNFAADFDLPSHASSHQRQRSRSGSMTFRVPPPIGGGNGGYPGRSESPGPRGRDMGGPPPPHGPPGGFRPGSRANSRPPPPGMPGMPGMGPGSRPGSRAGSRGPPMPMPPGHIPRGAPGSRRNSGGSVAGSSYGGGGGRKMSMSEADMDIALGMGQIPGQERKYRPPPQMRGPPNGGGGRPPPPPQGGNRLGNNGVIYPGIDDAFGLGDSGGRMPTMT